jgi:hypothetical protein
MAATRTFIAATADTTDQTTYTFAGASIGSAAADRIVVVGIAAREGGGTNRTLSSVSIAGVSATIVADSGNVPTHAAFAVALVPTGATGDIVVTFSAGMSRCVISVWSTAGMDSSAVSSDTADTTDPLEASVNIPAGGVAFGTAYDNGATTVTWTNLTEDYDAQHETRTFSFASAEFATLQTGLTLTADLAAASGTARGAFVTFGPAGSGQPAVKRMGGVPFAARNQGVW